VKIDLSKINLGSAEEISRAIQKTKTKKPKFLPGETRATVGSDGFRELSHRARAETYRRKLYANSEPRNCTVLHHTQEHPPVKIGNGQYSPHYLDSLYRDTLVKRDLQCNTAHYINRLHERLSVAAYRTWTVGRWTWCEMTCLPRRPQ